MPLLPQPESRLPPIRHKEIGYRSRDRATGNRHRQLETMASIEIDEPLQSSEKPHLDLSLIPHNAVVSMKSHVITNTFSSRQSYLKQASCFGDGKERRQRRTSEGDRSSKMRQSRRTQERSNGWPNALNAPRIYCVFFFLLLRSLACLPRGLDVDQKCQLCIKFLPLSHRSFPTNAGHRL